MKRFNERPGTVSNQYLHDLYRFFKLSVRKSEFRDIFKEKLDLHHVPALDNILYWEDVLFPIADFYLAKERWDEAIEIYEELESIGGFEGESAEYYQKFGYALQKRKKYAEAIQAYLKADTLKPDNIWNNRHLAICYRLNRNYQAALTYYKKVEEAAPEDTNVTFYIGSCLAELGQYEEALNYFFKLDFIENNCIKAWRGIGWCSFINQKHEQAMKYYEKIIEQKPLAIDYMNAGHVAWVMGDIQKAAVFYGKAITASGNRERFLEMFHKDEESLLTQGIREEDIPLMLDLL
jgi:tetratricopeptide repeat protein